MLQIQVHPSEILDAIIQCIEIHSLPTQDLV